MRNGMASRIRTTVVGSYPVLPWMVGNSSRLVLRDAIMAVLRTQELAGLDLVRRRGGTLASSRAIPRRTE